MISVIKNKLFIKQNIPMFKNLISIFHRKIFYISNDNSNIVLENWFTIIFKNIIYFFLNCTFMWTCLKILILI